MRRELRNPSIVTVFIIILLVAAVPLALFVPQWVDTTKESFEARSTAATEAESRRSDFDVLIPSQIVPWLADRVEEMRAAIGPQDWNKVSFRRGPCDPGNLTELPGGVYADSIARTCGDLDRIQLTYAGACTRAIDCNLPDAALQELEAVAAAMFADFANSGLVVPYSLTEEEGEP